MNVISTQSKEKLHIAILKIEGIRVGSDREQ